MHEGLLLVNPCKLELEHSVTSSKISIFKRCVTNINDNYYAKCEFESSNVIELPISPNQSLAHLHCDKLTDIYSNSWDDIGHAQYEDVIIISNGGNVKSKSVNWFSFTSNISAFSQSTSSCNTQPIFQARINTIGSSMLPSCLDQ